MLQYAERCSPFNYGNVGYLCQILGGIFAHHLACVALFFHLVDFTKANATFFCAVK